MKTKKDLNKRLRELREGNERNADIEKFSKTTMDAINNVCASILKKLREDRQNHFNDALPYFVPKFPIGGRVNFKSEYMIPNCISKVDAKIAIQKEIDRAVENEDYERAAALKKLI